MPRTVLSAMPNCFATRRAAALSHAKPTASSKRLLNGALLGNCSTFSALRPQSGHLNRYSSITTLVRYSKHGRSRTSLIDISDCIDTPAAPGTHIYPIASLAPHPKLQSLGRLVNLAPPHPVARPSQDLRPFVVRQTMECSRLPLPPETPSIRRLFRFSRRAGIRGLPYARGATSKACVH